MMEKGKKRIKLFLLIIMVAMVVASFVLIFSGHYTFGILLGGGFMFLANSIGQLLVLTLKTL